jgi:hypothetical protein
LKGNKDIPVYVTNRHVIPYNAFLISKLDCHVNVQLIAEKSGALLKYLFKYVNKGGDMVNMRKETEVDGKFLY